MLGPAATPRGLKVAVWSEAATRLWLCLYDGAREAARIPMQRAGDVHCVEVPGAGIGTRYGLRADGPWEPGAGLWFDPEKLLVDPYATALDAPFAWDARLALPRGSGVDTGPLVPKAVVEVLPSPLRRRPPRFAPGGLIYEVGVRAFTKLHPDVPEAERGTVAALGHPSIIAHLKRLHVGAVELMPITAWIDERHLAPLALSNAWGYNPVVYLAPDPRICPGGIGELRAAVAALHGAGIGVILDVVFNHTGEGDAQGATLSLRGLDARAYFRHDAAGRLLNDTGTGNTLACGHPAVRRLVLDAMRHFVERAGVDGFRFDLAPVLGRGAEGFSPEAPLLREMLDDPVLGDRVLIAEPWDVGPGGYRLGGFPAAFLEWNDRYRDHVRRFWRGDGSLGALVSAMAGSADVFPGGATRTVNFVAAHDGFALADLVAHEQKHNAANGEANRDGHGQNFSWNNGAEGLSDDPCVLAARRRDVKALLATLFASRGAIMLTAGDEFGRTQSGNNNSYAQDNAVTWLDWAARDRDIEGGCAALAALRACAPVLVGPARLTGEGDVRWLQPDGSAMADADWDGTRRVAMLLGPLAVLLNGEPDAARFHLPDGPVDVAGRTVAFAEGRAVTKP
ncbi:glycogen debranching protein GlgX [soil metagenome]